MTNSVSYKKAIEKIVKDRAGTAQIKTFDISTILAILFDKSKEETMEDLTKSIIQEMGRKSPWRSKT